MIRSKHLRAGETATHKPNKQQNPERAAKHNENENTGKNKKTTKKNP
jgi:hypothetical protein